MQNELAFALPEAERHVCRQRAARSPSPPHFALSENGRTRMPNDDRCLVARARTRRAGGLILVLGAVLLGGPPAILTRAGTGPPVAASPRSFS